MPSTPEVVRAEEKETAAPTAAEAVAPPEKRPRKTAASMQETQKSADQVADEIAKSKQETKPAAAYKFPTLSLLKKKAASGNGNSKAELEATGRQTGTDPPQFWHQCRGDRCHLWTDGYPL